MIPNPISAEHNGEGPVNTVFVEITLKEGHTVTVNPAMIVSIEPNFKDPEADRCYVTVGALNATQDPATGEWRSYTTIYHVMESREALQHRIDVIQSEARNEFFTALKQSKKLNDDDPDDPLMT